MKIEMLDIKELKPYKNNPRKNSNAIELVANSIKEFGFQNPIIIDKNNEIIAGHTRFEAARRLGRTTVPIIRANDLTPEQVKAFRIMDNKSAEFAEWDLDLLKDEFHELEDTDMFNMTGFSQEEITKIWDFEPVVPNSEKQEDNGDTIDQVEKLGKHVITCPKCIHKFERKDK